MCVVCIGSGSMGSALMKGIKNSDIYFTDTDTEKAQAAANAIGAKTLSSNIEAAKKGDFIFLAVKPQVLPQVLAEISHVLKERINNAASAGGASAGGASAGGASEGGTPPILVSMAAGWSIKKIQAASSAMLPVARIMPNTPALIGTGMTAMAVSPEVPAEKIVQLLNILKNTGIVDVLEEHYMDAVTGLSGSGPAFVYLFIEALADGGVLAGLPRDKALCYAAQTVLGAAAMVQETGKYPCELKDMVTSPGGTTIAGIAALEEGAFRRTVMKAVESAWRRAVELG